MMKRVSIISWCVLLAGVVAIYWPGLYGGFVFDDAPNILQNSELQIKKYSWPDFWSAAVSGHAGPLGRPIALLTFALNYYWADAFNPFHFKLVNLVIHLCNALLIGCFARLMCQVFARNEGSRTGPAMWWVGWVVAALWALHPLNLTAVLYVVQRMTSLCTLFGMAGLVVFAWYRNATYAGLHIRHPVAGGMVCLLAVAVLLLLSILSKESGALFAPLLLWTECCVFRFRFNNRDIRIGRWRLRSIVAWVVVLLAAYVCMFKLPAMVSSAAYANRDFTMQERVLTEARVLVFYLRMLALPINSQLSLYHDDFALSYSLLSPLSTLLAFIFLALVTMASWLVRRKFSALWFGWGWFLISHGLESTIFPLELVYEHRNYFAIIGLLMVVPIAVQRIDLKQYGRLLGLVLVVYLALLGFITHVRALQWSNNVDWAALEAANKPQSMRANYELGRAYILLMNATGDDKLGQLADDALIQATQNEPSSMLPLAARVQLAYMRSKVPDVALIDALKSGFSKERYKAVNTGILTALMNCQIQESCHMADSDFFEILQAALHNPLTPKIEQAEVLKLMAQYSINGMHDLPGGAALIGQSIALEDKASSRIMYAQALAMGGKFTDAMLELDKAELLDSRAEYTPRIARERANIQEAMTKQ